MPRFVMVSFKERNDKLRILPTKLKDTRHTFFDVFLNLPLFSYFYLSYRNSIFDSKFPACLPSFNFVCLGFKDCYDGRDEELCETYKTPAFYCKSRNTCMPSIEQCEDGSNELECTRVEKVIVVSE